MNKTRGLFWFRLDLRLHDNPALSALSEQVDAMTCVYLYPETFSSSHVPDEVGDGRCQKLFRDQSLLALRDALQAIGSDLLIVTRGENSEARQMAWLCEQLKINVLGVTTHGGFYERKAVAQISASITNLKIVSEQSVTLFNEEDLPFEINDMPNVFTAFRKKVEKHADVSPPADTVTALPPVLDARCQSLSLTTQGNNGNFIGGERAGLNHLKYYFGETRAASDYKNTRNDMDGWLPSTKFSPWLANGSLSPRTVYQRLRRYEQNVEQNESTYWIFFELLWREFFHWLQIKHGSDWFAYSGFQSSTPDTCFDQQTLKRWCDGNTGYDIVDACMRQLNQTGYMSNRGRQLVASCLVHELKHDWRCGAAYFEKQLIDYDVASNWGNWLYLAGVGSDPRGHRRFDLQKQADYYDKDGSFRATWLK
ncbi:DASH family cryptochrome [Alteromonas sp. H39]|uniref:DASH family cryptochrome n=1 Tax=Alteromonas sp. H39 TaxID=3389876 RepID=UPI0039E1956A